MNNNTISPIYYFILEYRYINKSTFNNVTINHVIKYVSRELKISERQLVGKGRTMEVAIARQSAMYLSRELTGFSLSNIGFSLGKRNHSTVIHACKKIEQLKSDDLKLHEDYNNIKRLLML